MVDGYIQESPEGNWCKYEHYMFCLKSPGPWFAKM
jgi:hypothetical protein